MAAPARLRGRVGERMSVVEGDITTLVLDAVVNAANSSLLGGGGVDGAIHRAAGLELALHCRDLGGCRTGDAKITPGFKLPARYVIHTVGPVWQGGGAGEADLLASCYHRALAVAVQAGVRSLAFPAISTGVYAFPPDLAAPIAVNTVAAFLAADDRLDDVVFCCFDAASAARHAKALEGIRADG